MNNIEPIALHQNQSEFRSLSSEWKWWLPGAIFAFVFASILMSGWPAGLLPELSYPYVYLADGLSHSWVALRAIEGWIFENPRSGFPFGSSFLDYPGSDAGNLLLLKLFGAITGEYHSSLNLFFLLSFPAAFVSSFFSLRTIGLSSALAVSASLLFAFLAFHFQRIEHLFYLWYFVAPVFFYFCFRFFSDDSGFSLKQITARKAIQFLASFVVLASFGVYYAFFGVILLSVTAFASFAKTGRISSATPAILAIFIVILGVGINVAPNIIHKMKSGHNSEVVIRSPVEAEVLGLKLMQIVLPRPDHRIPSLGALTQRYEASYPLVNENRTSGLGAVGAVGFMILLLHLLASLSGRQVDPRMSFLAMLVFVLFLFGTIGGFGALFSASVSSSIRGWNRISVFIAFGSIAGFFVALQIFIRHYCSGAAAKVVILVCGIVSGAAGLYDQTAPACQPCNEQKKSKFMNDKLFVEEIERTLPRGSAIYQLPYLPFPEAPQLHSLPPYDLSTGFLHSKNLKWSYAGMRGREGDVFFRALAKAPIEKQLETIREMGFSGIYIDRRGFADNGVALITKMSELLGSNPTLQRGDGHVVFFQLPNHLAPSYPGS